MCDHTLQARINVINNFPIESVMNETFSGLSFVNLILTFFSFKKSVYILNSWRLLMTFFYVYFYHLILRINHLSNIRLFEEYLFTSEIQILNCLGHLSNNSTKSNLSAYFADGFSISWDLLHVIWLMPGKLPLRSLQTGGVAYITVSEFLPHSLILHISVRGRDNWAHGTCPMFTQEPGLQSWS